MRRIEPAYPDLLPVTHVERPGYLPGPAVALDPIRMGIVWEDAPRRILPAAASVPREPVRAIAFARCHGDNADAVPEIGILGEGFAERRIDRVRSRDPYAGPLNE